MKVRIREGAGFFMDFGGYRWPKPGVDPDTVFTVKGIVTHGWLDLVAPGFGEPGNYGDGSIFASPEDCISTSGEHDHAG